MSIRLDREELKTFSEMRRERRKRTVPGDEHHPTDLVLDGVARVPLPEMRPLGTGFGTDHETSVQPTDLPVLLHGEDQERPCNGLRFLVVEEDTTLVVEGGGAGLGDGLERDAERDAAASVYS